MLRGSGRHSRSDCVDAKAGACSSRSRMKLTFCGANRTTTGSRHLFEINGRQLLLECGMYQGHRDESIEQNSKFLFDPTRIDVMLLSHAHIDHSGVIPVLCKPGYHGKIDRTDQ